MVVRASCRPRREGRKLASTQAPRQARPPALSLRGGAARRTRNDRQTKKPAPSLARANREPGAAYAAPRALLLVGGVGLAQSGAQDVTERGSRIGRTELGDRF